MLLPFLPRPTPVMSPASVVLQGLMFQKLFNSLIDNPVSALLSF